MKIKTDIIASIAESMNGQTMILVIMYRPDLQN